MAATYEPIATQTLGTAAASITFSSIPATYTDLRLIFVGNGTSGTKIQLRFNSDTGTNYSYIWLGGQGSSAYSGRTINDAGLTITTENNSPSGYYGCNVDIFSYSSSAVNKSVLDTYYADANGSGNSEVFVGLWRNNAIINSVLIRTFSGQNFSIGTTATLYGIKAA